MTNTLSREMGGNWGRDGIITMGLSGGEEGRGKGGCEGGSFCEPPLCFFLGKGFLLARQPAAEWRGVGLSTPYQRGVGLDGLGVSVVAHILSPFFSLPSLPCQRVSPTLFRRNNTNGYLLYAPLLRT